MSLKQENPLCTSILELLLSEQNWKIHTLANKLQEEIPTGALDACPNKDLFKRNFLIMNALYQLQDECASSGYQIRISSLEIKLEPQPGGIPVMPRDPLRIYYLDWQNYNTSSEEVEQLLASFWQNFTSTQASLPDEQSLDELLTAWQLPADYTLSQLTKQWRRFALSCHPDRKNGDRARFQRLENEYTSLRALLG